ncbi:hypothetical protein Lalb_Chr11g0071891 [Lupinus albus]|uniref:Uncharacterized protein n=1 Tax=Lupinus albus TaxID=3870 RepID=A0A6A4PSE3_LUPAL|nr:hypothetical protein Lalb_Chr11g0071891 [Lupinus albus]
MTSCSTPSRLPRTSRPPSIFNRWLVLSCICLSRWENIIINHERTWSNTILIEVEFNIIKMHICRIRCTEYIVDEVALVGRK